LPPRTQTLFLLSPSSSPYRLAIEACVIAANYAVEPTTTAQPATTANELGFVTAAIEVCDCLFFDPL